MKALSIDIFSRIKWFFSIVGFGSGAKHSHSKEGRLKKDMASTVTSGAGTEKFDLALFQRKAYHGNYFVGPYIFLNPNLFE